jgi:hypothetical protein
VLHTWTVFHGSCAQAVCCFASIALDRILGILAVPKVFREALVGAGWSVGRSPVHHAVTATDGTTKVRRIGRRNVLCKKIWSGI